MKANRRRLVEMLAEGKGIHTDRFQRCLQRVEDKEGGGEDALKSAYAICTSTFQKANYFKKGTNALTKKGSRILKQVEGLDTPMDDDALSEAKGKKKTPTLRLKNGLMGMRGGLIAVGRIIRDELATLKENPKNQKLYVELTSGLEQLERAHGLVAGLAAKVPEK